jgi:hypothetical protein
MPRKRIIFTSILLYFVRYNVLKWQTVYRYFIYVTKLMQFCCIILICINCRMCWAILAMWKIFNIAELRIQFLNFFSQFCFTFTTINFRKPLIICDLSLGIGKELPVPFKNMYFCVDFKIYTHFCGNNAWKQIQMHCKLVRRRLEYTVQSRRVGRLEL